MAIITPIVPQVGDLVWFNTPGKAYVPGPYECIRENVYMDIHTKQIVVPHGIPCLIEAETHRYTIETLSIPILDAIKVDI